MSMIYLGNGKSIKDMHMQEKVKKSTSDRGLPPLYFNIRLSSLSCVTFILTFCFGVLSPLPDRQDSIKTTRLEYTENRCNAGYQIPSASEEIKSH